MHVRRLALPLLATGIARGRRGGGTGAGRRDATVASGRAGARRPGRRPERADPRQPAAARRPASSRARSAYAGHRGPDRAAPIAAPRAPRRPRSRRRQRAAAQGRPGAPRRRAGRCARGALPRQLRGGAGRGRARRRRARAPVAARARVPDRHPLHAPRAPTRRWQSRNSQPARCRPRAGAPGGRQGPARRLPGPPARAARRRRARCRARACRTAAPRPPPRPPATSRSSPTRYREDRGRRRRCPRDRRLRARSSALRCAATREQFTQRAGAARGARSTGFTAAPLTRRRGRAARAAAAPVPRPDPGRVRPRRERRQGHQGLRDPGGRRLPRRRDAALADLADQLAKRDAARRRGGAGGPRSPRRAARHGHQAARRGRADRRGRAAHRPAGDRAHRRRCPTPGRRRPTSPTTT